MLVRSIIVLLKVAVALYTWIELVVVGPCSWTTQSPWLFAQVGACHGIPDACLQVDRHDRDEPKSEGAQ